MKAIISDKNSKLGAIPNVSLRPVVDCPKNAPCAKGCYALKFYRMYPTVRRAWDNNSDMVRTERHQYFQDIEEYLTKKQPRFFRWHVAGDIPDQDYLDHMAGIARIFPNIKFLAFTKCYDMDYSCCADNLSIVFSVWPGHPIPKDCAPRAYMQDGNEKRVPETALECPGLCHSCGMCWNLPKLGRDVVFHKH